MQMTSMNALLPALCITIAYAGGVLGIRAVPAGWLAPATAAISALILLHYWQANGQTMSESIQEALR